MKISNLRSLLSTPWAIHAGAASELLDRYVNHAQIGGSWTPREELTILELREIKSSKSISLKIGADETPVAAYQALSANAGSGKSNSKKYVAIMHVNGPMMKYGNMCSYGMDEMAAMVNELKADPNVVGLVSICDSPGGQIAGTSNFSNAVMNFGKPTIAFINDGFCASANYWYASSHDKIYTSTSTCEIGSIGVMCQLTNADGALEKAGIKRISVYSRLSPDKNKPFEEGMKGNTEPIKDNLDAIANEFHAHVVARRSFTDKKVLDGAMYLSEHAFRLGLTDGTKQLDEVMAEIMTMGEDNGTIGPNATGEKNKKIIDMTIKEFDTVKGQAPEAIKPESVKAINDVLTAEGITGVEVITKGSNTPTPVADTLTSMSAEERTTLNAAIKDKNIQVVAADATIITAEEKVTYDAWKKQASGEHTDDKGKIDKFEEGSDAALEAMIKAEQADLPI